MLVDSNQDDDSFVDFQCKNLMNNWESGYSCWEFGDKGCGTFGDSNSKHTCKPASSESKYCCADNKVYI